MGRGMPKGRPCTRAEMDELRDSFGRAAVSAKQYGFDGVEIHAAHGFLLDQFLWPETNLRHDGYGGPDMANGVRFAAEVVAAVHAAVGPDVPTR